MVKKLFYVFMAFLFLCAFTITTTPVYAQEEEEEVVVEDVADISLEDLLNVEITTAGRRAERIADIPASVVLITREEIERYGYQSLAEILENVSGLYVLDPYILFGPSTGVRGYYNFWPSNVIFLVNNVRQVDTFHENYQLQTFNLPVESIDRIEVVRGPMSVIYGTGAFFGAINIITDEPAGDEPVSSVSVTFGSEKTKRVGLSVAGKEGDFNYSASAGYYDTYGPNEPYTRMVSNVPALAGFGITDANASTDGRMEDTAKYFNFTGSYKGFYASLSYSQAQNEISIIFPPIDEGTLFQADMTHAQVGFKSDESQEFAFNGNVTYHNYKDKLDLDWLFPGFFGLQKIESEAIEVEANAYYTPSDKFDLTLGVYYIRAFNNDLRLDVPSIATYTRWFVPVEESVQTLAGYMQANFSLVKNFKLVAGVRVEKQLGYPLVFQNNPGLPSVTELSGEYERDKVDFIPRIAALFSIDEHNVIKLLYGKAIRRPTMFNTLDQILGGLPFLVPEEMETFELNFISTPSPKFLVNASVFYNKFNNLIIRSERFEGGQFVFYNTNEGRLSTTGAELTLQYKSDKFWLEVSGVYQKTKDDSPGFEDLDAGYSPQLLGYFKASYSFDFGAVLSVNARYIDKMETQWDVSLPNPDGTFGGRIGLPVDSHFIVDANLRFNNLFDQGLFLNFRVNNLLDTEFLYPNVGDSSWADQGIIGRGRTFLVTMGYRFIPLPMPQP
ncbi:MAG: TonB-dependent receptor plug domain-containing protein [Candidatus Aminicenantes bacterium]|jgi:outer membrane receptor protein involved in Fe transport